MMGCTFWNLDISSIGFVVFRDWEILVSVKESVDTDEVFGYPEGKRDTRGGKSLICLSV